MLNLYLTDLPLTNIVFTQKYAMIFEFQNFASLQLFPTKFK